MSEMDIREGVDTNNRNTIRTDLSLLLECLKFQMKCPDLQKQALLTIFSICEKKEHNVELLREMGGVAFLLSLSKSSTVQSDVKETALFTLGTLAEASVYCKNSLCRKEIFTDLADCLVKKDAPLTKKRVIVYFLSVLVANNKLGQTLAQNTSCLDTLLRLFRATYPLSAEGIFKTANSTQLHQLWSSVSSALCGCVNNPHNEEGQRACVVVFPTVKNWIQQISLPQTEIFQPICSFISMTVANNSCVQESFAASGGLENLTLALIRFCLGSETSLLACQLAVSTSKTLSACISDNLVIASELAKHELVCHLFSLLINPKLDSEDRLSVLLTIGHCTVASEEHQKQLVQIGSLPVIITLLAEDISEEVRKAATFILQTCKQASCVLRFDEVNSRTFTSLQSSCAHSCDMHKVLKDSMECYMSQHRRLFTLQEQLPSIQQLTNPSSENVSAAESHKNQKNWRGVSLTPIKRAGQVKCFQTADQREKHKDVRLTPLHKGMKMVGPAFFQRAGPVFSPFKRPHRSKKSSEKNKRKPSPDDGQMEADTSSNLISQRRKRQDFSREEELYLLCGVKTYGPSWNAILWSYPFQPGRTNVDLAKKYSRLMKNKTQDAGSA